MANPCEIDGVNDDTISILGQQCKFAEKLIAGLILEKLSFPFLLGIPAQIDRQQPMEI